MNRQISYNWLKEYVKLDVSIKEFVREFSLKSQTVERVDPVKSRFKKVVTAKIIKIEKHPNADRLSLATVEVGKKKYTVVCGAPNIAVGQIVPFAPEGAKLVDVKTDQTITLKKAVIRGVESRGMVCAPDELGLGSDHAGILILPDKTPVGKPLEEVLPLDDYLLDIEITTNRPDAMSVVGLAQEAAAVFQAQTKFKMPQPKMEFDKEIPLSVEVTESKFCPRYQTVVMTDVQITASPFWLQLRLSQAGIRPINNLVDITNYVLLEYGQPMHVFDYKKLQGKKIIVRNAKRGEKILALDGQVYKLNSDNLVIADEKNPVAIAGVMGGEKSAASEKTTTIVFECANFEPTQVRRTARALNLHSESSSLFEKGLNQENTFLAMLRAIELTKQLAKGKVASPIIDIKAKDYQPNKISFDPASVKRFLGVEIEIENIKKILESLGFEVTGNKTLNLAVPWWRANDVEYEHDVIEEIARIYGYHNLPAALPQGDIPVRMENSMLVWEDRIKDVLVGAGFTEVYNYSMVSAELFKKLNLGLKGNAIELSNPLNEEMQYLRTSLVPQILKNIADNQNNFKVQRLFELSSVYVPIGKNQLPQELPKLVVALSGTENLFLEIKGVMETLLEKLGIDNYVFSSDEEKQKNYQVKMTVTVGKSRLGGVGLSSAVVRKNFDIDNDVAYFTLDINSLMKFAAETKKYRPIPEFPSVERDLAIVLDKKVSWGQVSQLVEKTDRLVESISYLSTYVDKSLGAGKKSLALRLVFRSSERTLKSEEVDQIIKKIISNLEKIFSAVLR